MKELKLPVIRGEVMDDYGNGLKFLNEYIVLEPKRAKTFFGRTINVDSSFNDKFLWGLEDANFWFSINTKQIYWEKYMKIGHVISSRYKFPEWVGRSILVEDVEDIEGSISLLLNSLNLIETSIIDSYIKIQTIIPTIEVKNASKYFLKHIYSSSQIAYKDTVLKLRFSISKSKLLKSNENDSAYKIECIVKFYNEFGYEKIYNFEIFAYSPKYIMNISLEKEKLFTPHIIIKENINRQSIEDYALAIFSKIKASSELELFFKLSVFSDTFLNQNVIIQRLYSDVTHKLKTEYFDFR